jgi:hypothetical protein
MKKISGFIMLCRLDTEANWREVANPLDSDLRAAYSILGNRFNEYVEWLNCGVVYRVIRNKDLGKYSL